MKRVYMSKRGVLIFPIYITNKKIRKDTKKLAYLDFSEFFMDSLEDEEVVDDELFLDWARYYANEARN